MGRHSAKYFRPLRRRPLTVILPSGRPSTRQKFFNYFAECPSPGTRQSFFLFFLKITLPSAPIKALGKFFLFFLKKYFAECPSPGTRQRISGFFFGKTLPSALPMALDKDPKNCKKKITFHCNSLDSHHKSNHLFARQVRQGKHTIVTRN